MPAHNYVNDISMLICFWAIVGGLIFMLVDEHVNLSIQKRGSVARAIPSFNRRTVFVVMTGPLIWFLLILKCTSFIFMDWLRKEA